MFASLRVQAAYRGHRTRAILESLKDIPGREQLEDLGSAEALVMKRLVRPPLGVSWGKTILGFGSFFGPRPGLIWAAPSPAKGFDREAHEHRPNIIFRH